MGGGELNGRWTGVERPYSQDDVERLRGRFHIEHTLARRGAERLWQLLHAEDYVAALGALTGNQAVQQVRAGLKAIYLSGWQVAADANLSGQTYPDQSLYPANSVPAVVRRINNALLRADQIDCAPRATNGTDWLAPDRRRRRGRLRRPAQRLRADEVDDRGRRGRRALGGPARVREEVRPPGRQGAHPDGPAHPHPQRRAARGRRRRRADRHHRAHRRARRRPDHERRRRARPPFLTGERTAEGFFRVRAGHRAGDRPRPRLRAVRRPALGARPSTPDLERGARSSPRAIHERVPRQAARLQLLAVVQLAQATSTTTQIATFQRELAAMGYPFQFITLAGFHALNHSMFDARARLRRSAA